MTPDDDSFAVVLILVIVIGGTFLLLRETRREAVHDEPEQVDVEREMREAQTR